MKRVRAASQTPFAAPRPVLAGAAALGALVLLHTVALTPYTYSLDDVKYVTLWAGGALCLLAWMLLAMRAWIRLPSRPVVIAGSVFAAVLLASTAFAEPWARWSGWQFIASFIAAVGYALLASAVVSTRRLVQATLRFWVVLTLLTTGFGLLHYAGFMEHLYALLTSNASGTEEPGAFVSLVMTFAGRREMLSTILNSQFFGNFLTMTLPVCLAAALLELRGIRREDGVAGSGAWLASAGLGAAFSIICIFFTFSKTSMACVPLVLVAFPVLAHFGTRYRVLRVPAWPWALGLAVIVAATALYFGRADLKQRISTLDISTGSRALIWQGAAEIFADHPVLGAGPGSFRLVFPAYRTPDYHLTAVSNLTLYAHNLPLDLLAETGLLGFLSFGALLALLLAGGVRAFRRSESHPMRIAVLGYGLGAAMLLLGSLLTPMIRWPLGTVQLAVTLGLLAGASRTALEGDVLHDARTLFHWDRRARVAAAGAGLALVWFAAMSIWSVRFFQGSAANSDGIKATHYADAFVPMLARNPEELYLGTAGYLGQAVEHYERAISLNPTFVTTYYKLGHAFNRTGLNEKEYYRHLSESVPENEMPPADLRADLVRLLEQSVAHQLQAVDAYDRLEKYAPGYAETPLNRGIIRMTIADSEQRLAALAGDDAARTRHLEAARENYAAAVKAIENAVARSNKVSVGYIQGTAHERFADVLPPQSEQWRENTLAAADAYVRTRDLPLSHFQQEDDQLDRERDEKEDAGLRAPGLYARAGAWERAARAYEWLAAENPGRTIYVALAASNFERAGEPDAAATLLDDAIERHPLDAELRLRRLGLAVTRAEQSGDWRPAAEAAFLIDELARTMPGWLTAGQQNRLKDALRRVKAGAERAGS
ncbi:MAG: hypothetical protein PWP23_3235 [Candidatus Sumerlaeota bacterium]|nr:hypothetical protein [Candidatus Sumerlaeota bacterium]